MRRYVIERNLPGVACFDWTRLTAATMVSNQALVRLSGKVQWVQSFVVEDKTFCVYLAESEAAVQEHARLSGFPVNRVSEVLAVIDSTTAADH